jgi:hypothetical protein
MAVLLNGRSNRLTEKLSPPFARFEEAVKDELLSESALMNAAGGSPGVITCTIGVLVAVAVAVAVFSKVAVGWLVAATVATAGSVAGFIAAVLGALFGALLGVLPGVAGVKLHARMEASKTAIPIQAVKRWNLLRFISAPLTKIIRKHW